MATTFFRIVKYGFQSFWRNGLLSVATVNVLVFTLIVFEGLMVFNTLTNASLASLKEKIDISVYFKTTAEEEDILGLKRSLEGIEEVKAVAYVSRDEALKRFAEKHQQDPAIVKALEELGGNPLLASLNVKANDTKNYPVIAAYLENESFRPLIEKVTFAQTSKAIERFSRFIDTIERAGFLIIIFSALTAALITFNTIRLAIYSNRDEIGIMRLVGASNFFINGPYIIEAAIFGIIAAIVSTIILIPFISFTAPYVQTLIPEMNLKAYFYGNIFRHFGYQLLLGIGLGTISAIIAIRRYLKI